MLHVIFSFRAVWRIIDFLRNEEWILILCYFFIVSIEVDKFVGTETGTNSACTHNYKADYTSTKPFLVGIIVLASTAFIIMLLTLYTYRLDMRQQSRTEQKENVWSQIMFISVTQYNRISCNALITIFFKTERYI